VERGLTLPGPGKPAPEVHVAAGVATTLRFDAPIDRASVEVEGRDTHFHQVDPGERTLLLEPSLELQPGKSLEVTVHYRDGVFPEKATFALVSHPTQVDKEVKVTRPPLTLEALGARVAQQEVELTALRARCGASALAGLVFSGQLNERGIQVKRFDELPVTQAGLTVNGGQGYRASLWALVVLQVHNLPGQRPWKPGQARLTRPDGTLVKTLPVHMDKEQLAPGEAGLVALVAEALSLKEGEVLRLELLEANGPRRLSITTVRY
jgi:uncharacterized protein (TIGR02268 family)